MDKIKPDDLSSSSENYDYVAELVRTILPAIEGHHFGVNAPDVVSKLPRLFVYEAYEMPMMIPIILPGGFHI